MIKSAKGFTIVELMAVVVVLGVIAVAAAPSLSRFVTAQQLDAKVRHIQSALNLARSEAIKRNASVYVFPNGNWASGVVVSSSSTGSYSACLATPTPADCIKIFQASGTNQKVTVPAGTTSVEYTKTGRTSQNVSFIVCPVSSSDSLNQRELEIRATGLPTISHGGACS